jgi:hypothetical protein
MNRGQTNTSIVTTHTSTVDGHTNTSVNEYTSTDEHVTASTSVGTKTDSVVKTEDASNNIGNFILWAIIIYLILGLQVLYSCIQAFQKSRNQKPNSVISFFGSLLLNFIGIPWPLIFFVFLAITPKSKARVGD